MGAGDRTLTWRPQNGGSRIVLMNADGSSGLSASVSIGARFPDLLTVAIAVLGGATT